MTQSHCKGVCRGGAAIRCDVRDMKYQEVKRSKAQIHFPCKAQKIYFSTSCQNAALATSSYIQTEIEHNTSSLNIVNQILARNSIYQKKNCHKNWGPGCPCCLTSDGSLTNTLVVPMNHFSIPEVSWGQTNGYGSF